MYARLGILIHTVGITYMCTRQLRYRYLVQYLRLHVLHHIFPNSACSQLTICLHACSTAKDNERTTRSGAAAELWLVGGAARGRRVTKKGSVTIIWFLQTYLQRCKPIGVKRCQKVSKGHNFIVGTEPNRRARCPTLLKWS